MSEWFNSKTKQMPENRFPEWCFFTVMLAFAAATLSAEPEAARYQPYEPDAHTLHLWHLDEDGPPFADAVDHGVPLRGLLNGAVAGRTSMPGFGKAVNFNHNVGGIPGTSGLSGAILSYGRALENGSGDNAPSSFRYFGPQGAFTYEMIVKLDVMPQDAQSIALGLMTMEGDGDDRIFNLRIEKQGFLSFFPLPHGTARGGGVATIPTTGPNAVDTQNWFHVAVAYNGNGGSTNNLKLYWTRLGSGAVTANCIGSGTLSSDFNGKVGDFALGNEARRFPLNAEAEPFPGVIDEVRISGVARHASDYFFVAPDRRVGPEQVAKTVEKTTRPPKLDLKLSGIMVDSKQVPLPLKPKGFLELKSGLHRLDFDVGFNLDQPVRDVKLRCMLEGVDELWRDTELGMTFGCQALDADDHVISQFRFQAVGRSAGWETSLEVSNMVRRSEPVFIPAMTRKLKIFLASGSPDTTGFYAIDNMELRAPGTNGKPIWKCGGYAFDAITSSPAGYLPGWKRGGSEPAIARLAIRASHPAIGLVDGDQFRDGEWFTVLDLAPAFQQGGTFVLSWDEAFNVIDGDTHRATYVNVPPGRYTFRAMGLAGQGDLPGDDLELSVLIHPPFWQQFWFWPIVTAGLVAMVSAVIFTSHRNRAKRSLERLRFQNALEKDRMRIARDMHDDLGTRVTFINMSAALAQREIETSPQDARRHLAKMTESARDLVVAMDDLVWAVDPSHDTLDDLASHITRLAEEMFRDSSVRCRLDIPALLPALPLGSEFRHHVALAVKEALHNVLRHAGPCEVFLSLAFDGDTLRITIRDTGTGFDLASDDKGHGLGNLAGRFKEIGGTCCIDSTPGGGTCIVLSCPIAKHPR